MQGEIAVCLPSAPPYPALSLIVGSPRLKLYSCLSVTNMVVLVCLLELSFVCRLEISFVVLKSRLSG